MVSLGVGLDGQCFVQKIDRLIGAMLREADLCQSEPGVRQVRILLQSSSEPALGLGQISGLLTGESGEIGGPPARLQFIRADKMRSRVAVAVAIAEGRSVVQLRPLVFGSPGYRPRKQVHIVCPVL